MKQTLGAKVGFMCLILSGECAKMVCDTVQTYVCTVLAFFETCSKSAATLILKVDLLGNIAKIGKSVVQFVPVDMVDIVRGVDPRHIQPNKPVSEMYPVVDTYRKIPRLCPGPDSASSSSIFRRSHLPPELSGFRTVVKDFFESLASETRIVFAHAVAPIKHWFGKLPPRPASLGGCAILHPGA